MTATTPHVHTDGAGADHLLDEPVPRIDVPALVPDGYKALLGVETYARRNVEPSLYHLVKLRASIINGCSFCVDMHSRDAIAEGDTARRVFAVAAWHDAPFFTRRERAAFALTDAVTRLGHGGVPDDIWQAAASEFADEELANLLIAIGMINLWNRITVPSRTTPPAA